jgi:hypothetical protein
LGPFLFGPGPGAGSTTRRISRSDRSFNMRIPSTDIPASRRRLANRAMATSRGDYRSFPCSRGRLISPCCSQFWWAVSGSPRLSFYCDRSEPRPRRRPQPWRLPLPRTPLECPRCSGAAPVSYPRCSDYVSKSPSATTAADRSRTRAFVEAAGRGALGNGPLARGPGYASSRACGDCWPGTPSTRQPSAQHLSR